YISPGACAAVFARAQLERRVPNLALRLALLTPIGATPLLDYLIVSSDSVGDGLDRLVRYLRLVNPAVRLGVHGAGDPVRVVVTRASGPFEIGLTGALSIVRFMREAHGRLVPSDARLPPEPGHSPALARAARRPAPRRAGR